MDDLLSEFLIETSDRLAKLDADIDRFAAQPGDVAIQSRLSDLFHTIKGASGFLTLNRLEAIAQAGEDSLTGMKAGKAAASPAAARAVLEAIGVVRGILRALAIGGAEPAGDDRALLANLRSVPSGEPVMETNDRPESLSPRLTAEETHLEAPPSPARGLVATVVPATVSNVSLPVERLENFAGLVGQLVQTRNNLNHLMSTRDDAELEESIQRLSHITSDLGSGIVAVRRQALGQSANAGPGAFDIVNAVTVSSAGRRFAIPQRHVLELVWVTPSAGMGTANDEFRYLRLRDERHPWIRLSTILHAEMDRSLVRRREIVIMMQAGDETMGLSVEQVFDAEEIVVHRQPPLLAPIGLYSGNTILGDGSVAMVLDPNGVLSELRARQQKLIGERTANAALPAGQD